MSPDGALLAAGTHYLRLWHARDGALLRQIDPHYTDSIGVVTLAFSPNGKLLAGNGGVWQVNSGRLLTVPQQSHFIWEHVAFSADGRLLAAGTKDGKITLWQMDSGSLLRTLVAGAQGEAPSVAFSPDGSLLASGLKDIRLWRVTDGTLLRKIAAPSPWAGAVAFSPDGQSLATANRNTVRLWRVADGTLLRTLAAHAGNVTTLAYTTDGSALLAGTFDPQHPVQHAGALTLWCVEDGRLLRVYKTPAGVWSAGFSPDSRLIAYGLLDGTSALARNPVATGQHL
jgi:dipeptidyl aminopeptidase/acylaminoacyl peptidase